MQSDTGTFKEIKTYSRLSKTTKSYQNAPKLNITETLSSKEAIRFLLDGTLRLRVCRYCLNIENDLSELDEIIVLAGKCGLYEVTIKDIIAAFYPVKITYDANFPNKICKTCFDKALQCYLFTQQCEQGERALRNYFEDINDKFYKLDPMEPIKKRGKRKLNPNHNILYTEHKNVIDYAEPIMNLINLNALPTNSENNELECPKCWQVLPNQTSLVNHEKAHPKTMWYHCKLCGKAFVKYSQLKKHKRQDHIEQIEQTETVKPDVIFTCKQCGVHNNLLAQHLLHIEKHRFTQTLDDLIMKKKGSCAICFDKGNNMTSLNELMYLHGGSPGLTGEKSIYSIASTVFPDITLPCPGNSICNNCLNKLITSYIFILNVRNNRNRLDKCINAMLDHLENVDGSKNVLIEISQNAVLPAIDDNEDISINDGGKEEFLEDEFRIPESDSESDIQSNISTSSDDIIIENPAKNVTKTYGKKVTVNGYQQTMKSEYLDEFLTFNSQIKRQICKYTCPMCSKHFISDYFLKKHILRHTFKTVECRACLKKFKSRFYLTEHYRMVHVLNLERFSSCSVCGRSFKDSKKLKKHFHSHSNKECQLCDKFFKSQTHYNTHIQRHFFKFNTNRNSVQTCSFCEKDCSNENELSLHVNKVHLQMKPYGCDMCEKQFYTEYNLVSHKKLHSLKSKEECSFCHRVFKCRKNLVVHLRKHINIKPHYCPVCTKSFYSESSMKGHMKKIHGGRYCCRLCRHVVDSNTDFKHHLNVAHSCM